MVEDALYARRVYFQALRRWMHQAKMHQKISASFPYQILSVPNTAASGRGDAVPLNNNWLVGNPAGLANHAIQILQQQQVINENATPEEVIAEHGGLEYVVAPLYKRVLAELIDFIFLFMLKLAVTYVAVDYFNYIDVDSFDGDWTLETFTKYFDDYKQAIEITSEIIVLECVYRFLVCLFEACCLWAGGATPGKALMGLKLVSARVVLPARAAGRPTVVVHPGGEVPFFAALSRSLIKNILISLLFPLFVILFLFHDNRMGYDVLCGVIVVEENMFPVRQYNNVN